MYWEGDTPYYGFGLGAASLLRCRRFSRPRSMGAYRQWVTQFAASAAGMPGEGPPLLPPKIWNDAPSEAPNSGPLG